MREMSELTQILHDAGSDSLVLLDEVGRGTATTDGRAIARAAVEFVHDELGATALFATHYHELTDLADERERVFNLHFTATREDGEVTFLHRVVPGASSSSYGVEVAELAGVPTPVVDRSRALVEGEGATRSEDDAMRSAGLAANDGDVAEDADAEQPDDASLREFLAEEESRGEEPSNTVDTDVEPDEPRPTETDDAAREPGSDGSPAVAAALGDLDLARMTPIEALNALHDLQSRLRDER